MNLCASKCSGTLVQEVLVYGHAGSVQGMAWHPERAAVFATACHASRVFVFDASCREVIKTCVIGFSLQVCAWSTVPICHKTSHHLAVGGTKGKVMILDELTLRPVWQGKDSQQSITDLKYSPNGKTLAAASMDRHIDLYAVGQQCYTKVARCNGHSSVVRQLDWSSNGSVIQSVCSAYEILHWNGHNGKQITSSQHDTAWHTWTCCLGFPVMGIWPDGADGSDVNAVDRDPSGTLLATADDRGLVKLFNYPCIVKDAPHRAYIGHASHVAAVRFNCDGSWLASAGCSDRSVFQFKVVNIEAVPEPEPDVEPTWGSVDGKVFGWTTHPQATASWVPETILQGHAGANAGSSVTLGNGTEQLEGMNSIKEEDPEHISSETGGW
jgi:echinoderm microtubule-associated protein-like 6